MKKNNYKKNGKKGGRPKGNTYSSSYTIPDYENIILTEAQHIKLIERFGAEIIKKALIILKDWLLTSPAGYKYRGKNNYALFRSDGWLINEAKISIQQT